MNPFISVCVPVYNADLYLEECIKSILEQSFQDFELILVDDGSTDNSPAICDAWAQKSDIIHTIHTVNSGDTAARGAGAALAKGEWVLFVDADDTLPKDSLSILAEGTKEDTDIVVGFLFETQQPSYFIANDEWRKRMIIGDIILCSPCARLFRRTILSEESFFLIHPKRAGTDMVMNERIAFSTEKPILILNRKVYEYKILPNSLSHSARWTSEMIMIHYEDILDAVPSDQVQNMMPALIESRLKSIQQICLSQTKRRLASTSYIDSLRKDIKDCHFPLSFGQRLSVCFPDSFLTTLLHRSRYRMTVGKEFIQRMIREHIKQH